MAAVGPCYSSDSCARSHTAKFCKFASELQIHERLTRRQGALTIETVSLSCLRTRQLASQKAWESNFGIWLISFQLSKQRGSKHQPTALASTV